MTLHTESHTTSKSGAVTPAGDTPLPFDKLIDIVAKALAGKINK